MFESDSQPQGHGNLQKVMEKVMESHGIWELKRVQTLLIEITTQGWSLFVFVVLVNVFMIVWFCIAGVTPSTITTESA